MSPAGHDPEAERRFEKIVQGWEATHPGEPALIEASPDVREMLIEALHHPDVLPTCEAAERAVDTVLAHLEQVGWEVKVPGWPGSALTKVSTWSDKTPVFRIRKP